MGREEVGRDAPALTALELAHPLPQACRGARVVAGGGGEAEADQISCEGDRMPTGRVCQPAYDRTQWFPQREWRTFGLAGARVGQAEEQIENDLADADVLCGRRGRGGVSRQAESSRICKCEGVLTMPRESRIRPRPNRTCERVESSA